MLEFAYTGEVNVAQELLPALLHTARAFRIKGLDKVESPVADNAAAAGKLGHRLSRLHCLVNLKYLAQVLTMMLNLGPHSDSDLGFKFNSYSYLFCIA